MSHLGRTAYTGCFKRNTLRINRSPDRKDGGKEIEPAGNQDCQDCSERQKQRQFLYQPELFRTVGMFASAFMRVGMDNVIVSQLVSMPEKGYSAIIAQKERQDEQTGIFPDSPHFYSFREQR